MTTERRRQPRRRTLLFRSVCVAVLAVLGAGRWAATRPARAADAPLPPARAAEPATAPPTAVSDAQARGAQSGCEGCHGELELLRQQAGSLTRARALLVPGHVVAASAHTGMACAECHTGFGSYPHPERSATKSCASCHAGADTLWRRGAHAHETDAVSCAQCHGAHDIRTTDELRAPERAVLSNAPCLSCHQADAMPAHEPHAAEVPCASCHGPHDVRPVDDPESWLAPGNQMRTCGACHDTIASVWQRDIHGDAALRAAHLSGREPAAEVVSCTSCHVGHMMVAVADTTFPLVSVERCATCHEKAARTFFGSYHGKATALGSRVSAACYDCHSAHEILPDSMPASHVSEQRLVGTCQGCHEHARPAFVKYDSHPDPFNRHRNPYLFFAFFGMNGLLVFVLVVFGAHTLLWWWRLWLDRRRGIVHGPGMHHGGPGHGSGHGNDEEVQE